MKTPRQKLGYKVGDKFKIIRENDDGFLVGIIVRLCKDEGTAMPLFSGNNRLYSNAYGKGGAFTRLENVKPIKPKKAAEPAQEAQGEPTVQRKANGRPVGAKEGDWFRVIKSWHFAPGTITTLQRDDGTSSPFFTDTGDKYLRGVAELWVNMEPCPAPSQPEPECPQDSTCTDQGCPCHYAEPAKPEWEILWGSAKDFEGAPDWAVYAVGTGSKFWVEDVTLGAKLMRYDVEERVLSTVHGVANYRPYAARRLKQPK